MKLVVPQIGNLHSADCNLIELAQFLGVDCESVFLAKLDHHHSEYLEKVIPQEATCLVVNCGLIKKWTGDTLPPDLISYLISHFPFLLVHGLTPDPFCSALVRALSGGQLQDVRPLPRNRDIYQIAKDSRDVCGAFSGVSFGPVNSSNDCIIRPNPKAATVRTLISIDDNPFMVLLREKKAEILLLASRDTIGVSYEVKNNLLSEYFSRFVPHAMALRFIFGTQCWQPREHHASFIVDDPILWPNYGFLNFDALIRLMGRYNFSTTIAFIPHNYRRNSKRILEMFQKSGRRLGICFHGNDHTAKELASENVLHLNTLIGIAEARMDAHRRMNGLNCNRVMVFPQECFSVQAMKVLKCRNFYAAVCSTPHPAGCRVSFTLGEFAQPAILRHGDFPLFLRKYVQETKTEDVAFNLFFGRPVLIVDHHQVFRRPEPLLEVVSMINSLEPNICWSDLETVASNSILWRRGSDGFCTVRAYSSTVRLMNERSGPDRFSVKWNNSDHTYVVERVLRGGEPVNSFEVDKSGVRVSTELEPGSSQEYSILYRNDYKSLKSLGFRWNTKAYLRRRMCDFRDNVLVKNENAIALAEALRRHLSP